jgi:hypothetical protein
MCVVVLIFININRDGGPSGKSSHNILPGLEGAWATPTGPLDETDDSKDVFQGTIKMESNVTFLEDLEQYKAN